MKIRMNSKLLFALISLTTALMLSACGASVEKLNKRGNEAYSKQQFEEALVAYQAAQIESPELAEPYYNAANVLYRQGNYPEAVKQLSIALSYADEDPLKNSGLYNLGNNAFNSQELEAAVEAYKEALLINANDLDAKYNLELALQQQEKQQQEQEQQNQDQNSESQDSEQDQNQNNESENQEAQSENEDPKDGEQSEGDSDSNEDQQNNSNQSQDQGEEQSELSEQQNQEDQSNQSGQDQGHGQPGSENQNNQDQNEGNIQVPAPGQRMTAEQAEQLLAAIAQDMETLQERLDQVLFVQELPPAQDW